MGRGGDECRSVGGEDVYEERMVIDRMDGWFALRWEHVRLDGEFEPHINSPPFTLGCMVASFMCMVMCGWLDEKYTFRRAIIFNTKLVSLF